MGRENMLRVRFSDEEFQRLKTLSDSAGLSMSELVRDHLDKVKVRDKSEERQRNINLNRINANLNMIAKWVNTHKELADVLRVTELLISIQRGLKP